MKQENRVYCFCPVCKEEQPVTAAMTKLDFCLAPAVYLQDQITIGWNDSYIAGDFEYICKECQTVIAKDLNELRAKVDESEAQLQRLYRHSVEQ